MALPDVGLITVEDAETGEQLLVDAADPAFRERYARIAEEQEAALRAALGSAGVDTLELATDDDLLDALLRFADLRRQPLALEGFAASAGASARTRRAAWRASGGRLMNFLWPACCGVCSCCRCWWCCTSGCSSGGARTRCGWPASRSRARHSAKGRAGAATCRRSCCSFRSPRSSSRWRGRRR